MAMPQRDETIEEIKPLLGYAVMHGENKESERFRAELKRLVESI